MFEGISIAENFSKVNEISKGMSGDRKYYIETRDGKKLLLRITEVSNYETKKKDRLRRLSFFCSNFMVQSLFPEYFLFALDDYATIVGWGRTSVEVVLRF